jgi:hypothetical protein
MAGSSILTWVGRTLTVHEGFLVPPEILHKIVHRVQIVGLIRVTKGSFVQYPGILKRLSVDEAEHWPAA